MKLVLEKAPPAGLTLRIGSFQPLPPDLEAWRADVLSAEPQRVVAAVDRETVDGWKVNLVVSETATLRRLHALYRFAVYGCVVVAEAGAHAFDAAMDDLKEALLAARPDFTGDRPASLSEVWAGFDDKTRH
jgi:hypothetical protein